MTSEEIKAYIRAIEESKSEDEILSLLPDRSRYNFEEVMQQIMNSLRETLDVAEELNSDVSQNETPYDIEALRNKIDVCEEYLHPPVDDTAKNIVFAKTNAGNFYIDSDLKDIEPENYEVVMDVLDFITSGEQGGHNVIKGVFNGFGRGKNCIKYKPKGKQIRVYGYSLDDKTVYIFGVFTKKFTDRALYNDRVLKRMKEAMEVKNEVKNQFSGDYKQQLIEEGAQKLQDIVEYLEANKRTRKKKSDGQVGEDLSEAGKAQSEEKNIDLDQFVPTEQTDNRNAELSAQLDPEWIARCSILKEIHDKTGALDFEYNEQIKALDLDSFVSKELWRFEHDKLSDYEIELLQQAGVVFPQKTKEHDGGQPLLIETLTREERESLSPDFIADYYALLRLYKAEGDVNVDVRKKIDDIRVGKIVSASRRRYRHGKLTPLEVKLCENIGLDLDGKKEVSDDMKQDDKPSKPIGIKADVVEVLEPVVNKEQEIIVAEKVEPALEAPNGEISNSDNVPENNHQNEEKDKHQSKWEEMEPLIKEFYDSYGDCNIPSHYTTPSGIRLGKYLDEIRWDKRNGDLPKNIEKSLTNSYEFNFTIKTPAEKTQEMIDFYESEAAEQTNEMDEHPETVQPQNLPDKVEKSLMENESEISDELQKIEPTSSEQKNETPSETKDEKLIDVRNSEEINEPVVERQQEENNLQDMPLESSSDITETYLEQSSKISEIDSLLAEMQSADLDKVKSYINNLLTEREMSVALESVITNMYRIPKEQLGDLELRIENDHDGLADAARTTGFKK